MVVDVTDADFESVVLGSDLAVMVDIWAPWCGPCKMIAPVLKKIAGEYGEALVVAKVNTDENPEWAIGFGVQGIPTLLFINKGEAFDRQVGSAPPPVIEAKAEVLLKAFQAVG